MLQKYNILEVVVVPHVVHLHQHLKKLKTSCLVVWLAKFPRLNIFLFARLFSSPGFLACQPFLLSWLISLPVFYAASLAFLLYFCACQALSSCFTDIYITTAIPQPCNDLYYQCHKFISKYPPRMQLAVY